MEWSASFNSIKIHFIKWLESNRYPWNRKKTGCIWEEICILYYKCGQNPSMSSVPCTVLPSLCIDRFFSACVGSVICIWFGVVFLLLLFIAVLYCNSQTNLIYGFLRIQMMCYNDARSLQYSICIFLTALMCTRVLEEMWKRPWRIDVKLTEKVKYAAIWDGIFLFFLATI